MGQRKPLKRNGNPRLKVSQNLLAAADVKDTAELGRQWKRRLRSRGSRLTVQKTEGRGLCPGLLIYVVMTAGAAADSTGALRRRTAAEMRVMMSPTGNGSMKV